MSHLIHSHRKDFIEAQMKMNIKQDAWEEIGKGRDPGHFPAWIGDYLEPLSYCH